MCFYINVYMWIRIRIFEDADSPDNVKKDLKQN